MVKHHWCTGDGRTPNLVPNVIAQDDRGMGFLCWIDFAFIESTRWNGSYVHGSVHKITSLVCCSPEELPARHTHFPGWTISWSAFTAISLLFSVRVSQTAKRPFWRENILHEPQHNHRRATLTALSCVWFAAILALDLEWSPSCLPAWYGGMSSGNGSWLWAFNWESGWFPSQSHHNEYFGHFTCRHFVCYRLEEIQLLKNSTVFPPQM